MAAHVRVPLPITAQRREQQSASLAQTSPMRCVHARPSVPVHARFMAQRATPSGSEVQLAEQQSAPMPQSSPPGRQPVSTAHRRSPLRLSHTWPQQSASAPQLSPAGWQAGAAAQAPTAHAPLQQSAPSRHGVPEIAHALPSTRASAGAASMEPPSGPSRMVSDTASHPDSASAAIVSVRTLRMRPAPRQTLVHPRPPRSPGRRARAPDGAARPATSTA